MKQMEKDKICYYCMGCNKLEDEKFEGTIRCNYFVTGRDNWHRDYTNAIKEKKNGKKEKRI